ncbi:transcription regulator (putative) [Lactobacillus plantarum subsp. plantarum ST-III] [Lactiplantibacillus mudanjiangensis]|uniref:TetR/AcrR family transcriptional regulator n=1 Tax=Lactiplantibacillus mudanjiangensis TaxID=1296538 RepID=UPI0010142289|nr:transcription regulator (putative) [Lactobacillus plantarum subsp. plantarum ST-III] [Lactiplantibacillus mudanjiangensis]
MKITGNEDLRVQKTINGIYAAFEALICEKDYERITVKTLTDRAQINKKTFYRYYPTLDDLLAELQARYSQDYLKTVGTFSYPQDLGKSVRTFIEYSARQNEAYEKITCSGTYVGIRQQMIDQVMKSTWQHSPQFQQLSPWQQRTLISFIQNTGLEVYKQWVADGKQAPVEDVVQAAEALMSSVDRFLNLSK